MKLFGKKDKKKCCCSASAEDATQTMKQEPLSGILILGSGCAKCNELELHTKEALAELSIEEDVAHVTDFLQIAAYGVMTTPALVLDGKVVSCGKVLKTAEIKALLEKRRDSHA